MAEPRSRTQMLAHSDPTWASTRIIELERWVEALEAQRDEALKTLARIERLKARWDAPLSHEPGDWGEAAWAAVGSEAHKIATDARRRILSGGRVPPPDED